MSSYLLQELTHLLRQCRPGRVRRRDSACEWSHVRDEVDRRRSSCWVAVGECTWKQRRYQKDARVLAEAEVNRCCTRISCQGDEPAANTSDAQTAPSAGGTPPPAAAAGVSRVVCGCGRWLNVSSGNGIQADGRPTSVVYSLSPSC